MLDKKYSNLQIHKALKIILGINYNFKWLDVEISPNYVTWYVAVQFRNDDKKHWMPRIVSFYPGAQKVAVKNVIDDPEPIYIEAETIVTMAEIRAQTPIPPKPA